MGDGYVWMCLDGRVGLAKTKYVCISKGKIMMISFRGEKLGFMRLGICINFLKLLVGQLNKYEIMFEYIYSLSLEEIPILF